MTEEIEPVNDCKEVEFQGSKGVEPEVSEPSLEPEDGTYQECEESFLDSNEDKEQQKVSSEDPLTGSKVTDEPYECKVCSKTFSYKKTLARHVRNKHSPLGKPCICPYCHSRFNDKWAMGKHIQSTHMKKHHVVICPICHYKDSKVMIDIHFAKSHNILLEEEFHRFSNSEEFEKWKNKTEKSTVARFVVNQKFKKKNGAERIIYNCHRSGFFKPRGKNKRKIKSQGTNKIMGFCPARLEFEALENGEVIVQFIKTHVGHENDVEKVFSQYEIRHLSKKPPRTKSAETKNPESPRVPVLIDYCQIGNLTVSELKPVVVRGYISNNNNLISIISAPDESCENFVDSSPSESMEESATLHSATVINVNGITTVDLSGDMSLDVANVLDKDCGQTRPEMKFDIPDLGMVDHNISEVLDLSKLLAVRLGDEKLHDNDDSFQADENEEYPDLDPLDGPRFDPLDGLENPKPPDEQSGLMLPSPDPDLLSEEKQRLISRFIEIIQAVESRELLWDMKRICVPAMETMESLFDHNFYENTC